MAGEEDLLQKPDREGENRDAEPSICWFPAETEPRLGRRSQGWEEVVSSKENGGTVRLSPGAARSGELSEAPTRMGLPFQETQLESGPKHAVAQLYQTLRKKELMTQRVSMGKTPWEQSQKEDSVQKAAVDVYAWDQAVQRDARRYDNGFSLL